MTRCPLIRAATVATSLALLAACASASRPEPEPAPPAATSVLPVTLPAIRYPDMLRSANIEGEVVVDVAVDSSGRTDWQRSRVLRSTHDLFTAAVKNAFRDATWAPATIDGVATTATWRDTIEFALVREDRATCETRSEHRQRICARPTLTSNRSPMSSARRQELLAILREGRARWALERPARYRIEVTENAGMIAYETPLPRRVAEVDGDSVVRVVSTAPGSRAFKWTVTTVEQLFASLEHHVRTTGAQVDVLEIDPQFGYPRRLHSDVQSQTDSKTDIRVAGFTPLPPRRRGSRRK